MERRLDKSKGTLSDKGGIVSAWILDSIIGDLYTLPGCCIYVTWEGPRQCFFDVKMNQPHFLYLFDQPKTLSTNKATRTTVCYERKSIEKNYISC
jgi:hypothetical protein